MWGWLEGDLALANPTFHVLRKAAVAKMWFLRHVVLQWCTRGPILCKGALPVHGGPSCAHPLPVHGNLAPRAREAAPPAAHAGFPCGPSCFPCTQFWVHRNPLPAHRAAFPCTNILVHGKALPCAGSGFLCTQFWVHGNQEGPHGKPAWAAGGAAPRALCSNTFGRHRTVLQHFYTVLPPSRSHLEPGGGHLKPGGGHLVSGGGHLYVPPPPYKQITNTTWLQYNTTWRRIHTTWLRIHTGCIRCSQWGMWCGF